MPMSKRGGAELDTPPGCGGEPFPSSRSGFVNSDVVFYRLELAGAAHTPPRALHPGRVPGHGGGRWAGLTQLAGVWERELQALPFDVIKIDAGFVRAVVAEGIEEEVDVDFLGRLGCDVGQGWLLGRPVPAKQAMLLTHGDPLSEERTRQGRRLPVDARLPVRGFALRPQRNAGGPGARLRHRAASTAGLSTL
jgi:hypothetical protein